MYIFVRLTQQLGPVSYTHLDVYKRQVKKYDVELKNETGFASFTVPNQVGDTTISEAEATNTVAIKMPFGTDWPQKIIPTFTVGRCV